MLAGERYRDGPDNVWFSVPAYGIILNHAFPRRGLKLFPNDVAFVDLCVQAALRGSKLSQLDHLEEAYDDFVVEMKKRTGQQFVISKDLTLDLRTPSAAPKPRRRSRGGEHRDTTHEPHVVVANSHADAVAAAAGGDDDPAAAADEDDANDGEAED